jgi:CDK inhibitor PHO81
VQPVFNRDVISELSDQATTNLLDFAAWAEGERMQYTMTSGDTEVIPRPVSQDETDFDTQVFQAIAAGNLAEIQDWAARVSNLPDARQRITKAFLSSAEEAPETALQLLLQTGQVDLNEIDDINQRNILHRAALSGRQILLQIGIAGDVDVRAVDVYGRIPLHYACIRGSVDVVQLLLETGPDTVDIRDHDNFTPLIHAIVHTRLAVVHALISFNVKIDRLTESDHIPLNLACQHGSMEIVQELLQRRPQILPDAEGLYPQHLVARSSRASPQLLLLLREYGVDLDQADKLYQWTPLFHAASEGNVGCLEALLECGVNPTILDEKGLSALYYATWEGHLDCMKMLASRTGTSSARRKESQVTTKIPSLPPSLTPHSKSKEAFDIPPLTLPSPIIPVRRYGHNFLDSKTFVIINFGNLGYDAMQFYEENRYPAARLTISSKSSDLIPQNLLLPIQDDYKIISFQIDNVDTFAIEFDVYPTFGARVIARAVASSKVFTERSSSSGKWHLELLDPRLRAIGRVSFNFQVIKPYSGMPLEITHFAVYWKETDQKPHNASLITGSSLSGDYCRLYVQMTRDGMAILVPTWKLSTGVVDVPVNRLLHAEYLQIGKLRSRPDTPVRLKKVHDMIYDDTNSHDRPFCRAQVKAQLSSLLSQSSMTSSESPS